LEPAANPNQSEVFPHDQIWPTILHAFVEKWTSKPDGADSYLT
jgi:hypothetical protein